MVADYGITPMFGHELIKVDGGAQKATFRVSDDQGSREVEESFDMLHVVPPAVGPGLPAQRPLWWTALAGSRSTARPCSTPATPTIFALGDCSNTPNSKTAAAVRGQAPIAAHNVLAAVEDRADMTRYDGYASCPLTTSHERVMLAEFGYDGKIMPSFPADPRKPPALLLLVDQAELSAVAVLADAQGQSRPGLAPHPQLPRKPADRHPSLIARTRHYRGNHSLTMAS